MSNDIIYSTYPTYSKYRNDKTIMEALKSLPGFTEAGSALAEAEEKLRQLYAQRQELDNTDLTDTIIETGHIPDSWLKSIAAKQVERATLDLTIGAVDELQNRAKSRLESLASMGTDSILSHLDTKLQDLIDSIRPAVEELNGAATAADAVELGTAEAWRKISHVTGEYNQLRASQEKVMIDANSYVWSRARSIRSRDVRASDGIIGNLDTVWPTWNTREPVPAGFEGSVFSATTEGEPWPFDNAEFLAWAVSAGALLWIPTVRELITLSKARHEDALAWADELAEQYRKNRKELEAAISDGKVPPLVQKELWNRGLL
ncbi:hypothetical protein OG203_24630 [Nocardia sp. NBC_01499]|uniref:hypothetical protein n=1 Tax=Nocardia sp. NBC_01499 TaxID=2903597 RepID=UPI00386C4873